MSKIKSTILMVGAIAAILALPPLYYLAYHFYWYWTIGTVMHP